ncbi:MAG: hypothetical protein LJE94_15540 [Deltaproteobacteria bacterium]|nr:hypothetical protein [Deltaproteobacteria bacterium]
MWITAFVVSRVVGAFDPHGGQVTVLDVDAEVAHPYRIDFDTFYRGLASNYHHILRPFGYTGGGYVYIRLERKRNPFDMQP